MTTEELITEVAYYNEWPIEDFKQELFRASELASYSKKGALSSLMSDFGVSHEKAEALLEWANKHYDIC